MSITSEPMAVWKKRFNKRIYIFKSDAIKCVLRVFTNLSRTLLACRRSFSRTAFVPGSSQSSSALEQQVAKTQQVSLILSQYYLLNSYKLKTKINVKKFNTSYKQQLL